MAILINEEAEARTLKARKWIGARLQDPAVQTDFSGLYSLFSRTVVTFVCAVPNVFEHGDWLVGKIRGAWGQALFRQAEKKNGDSYIYRPSAKDVFWEGHKVIGEAPGKPPYVIHITRKDGLLLVHLTLFGWSNVWRDQASMAMEAALERGINLNENTHYRGAWKVLDKYWQWHAFIPKRKSQTDVFLYWDTPLRQGGRKHMIESHSKFILGLAKRIKSLSRWNSVDLVFDEDGISQQIMQIKGTTLPPKYVTTHSRRSSQSPGKVFEMSGVSATTLLENVPQSIWPILDIGEICWAGSNTSFGYGKYRI